MKNGVHSSIKFQLARDLRRNRRRHRHVPNAFNAMLGNAQYLQIAHYILHTKLRDKSFTQNAQLLDLSLTLAK